MRRLELEAQCNEREELQSQVAPPSPAKFAHVGASSVDDGDRGAGGRLRSNSIDELTPVEGSASPEGPLREDLRKAKLEADMYQHRTMELERVRLEMEEEAVRAKHERDREEFQRSRLEREVASLRAQLEGRQSGSASTEAARHVGRAGKASSGGGMRGAPGHGVHRMCSSGELASAAVERSKRFARATDPVTPRSSAGSGRGGGVAGDVDGLGLSARLRHASAPDLRAGLRSPAVVATAAPAAPRSSRAPAAAAVKARGEGTSPRPSPRGLSYRATAAGGSPDR